MKSLAEIVALIAVVASLGAVAFELRQTQGVLQAQACQARGFDGITLQLEVAQNEDLARVMRMIFSPEFDPSQLSLNDHDFALSLLTILRIDSDNEHYQYQKGFLDPGFYHGETVESIRLLAPKWRKIGLGEPRPEFHEEVERILAE